MAKSLFQAARHALGIMAIGMLVLGAGGTGGVGGGIADVQKYGASGNGKTMDTAAIQKAIDAMTNAGGGIVEFPPGTYLSGSLDLKSHVTLQLDKGATLLGSTRHEDYRKVHFHALLLADNQDDIGICGQGTIDGQGKALAADTTRLWKEKKLETNKEPERPCIINFCNCRGVTIRDITLRNSACWTEDYLDCDNVTVENITVHTDAAINNDGIDVTGCVHAVVRGCNIDSEDDGICLKSEDRACDDVLVENCRVRSSCNGLKFGTASVGGFRNITCRNLEIYDTYQSGIALEIVDGGEMTNVNLSNIKITDTNNPIFIRIGHRNVDGAVGTLHNVTLSDITADIPNRKAESMDKFPDGRQNRPTLVTASITGQPGNPVQDVTLNNITITYGGAGNESHSKDVGLDRLSKVPEASSGYPESTKFGTLPAWGFYCRHAQGIKFNNVTLRVSGSDYRPAIVCDDVHDIALTGFHVLSATSQPVIVLNDVHGATIIDSAPPSGADEFVKAMGGTDGVTGP